MIYTTKQGMLINETTSIISLIFGKGISNGCLANCIEYYDVNYIFLLSLKKNTRNLIPNQDTFLNLKYFNTILFCCVWYTAGFMWILMLIFLNWWDTITRYYVEGFSFLLCKYLILTGCTSTKEFFLHQYTIRTCNPTTHGL